MRGCHDNPVLIRSKNLQKILIILIHYPAWLWQNMIKPSMRYFLLLMSGSWLLDVTLTWVSIKDDCSAIFHFINCCGGSAVLPDMWEREKAYWLYNPKICFGNSLQHKRWEWLCWNSYLGQPKCVFYLFARKLIWYRSEIVVSSIPYLLFFVANNLLFLALLKHNIVTYSWRFVH